MPQQKIRNSQSRQVRCRDVFTNVASTRESSLPEFMDFILFGRPFLWHTNWTILVPPTQEVCDNQRVGSQCGINRSFGDEPMDPLKEALIPC